MQKMKKIGLSLAVASALSIGLIGCGSTDDTTTPSDSTSESSSQETANNNEDTSTFYTTRDYLFPSENQEVIYMTYETYSQNSQIFVYDDDIAANTVVNGNIITETTGDEDDKPVIFTVFSDHIEMNDTEENMTMNILASAQIGQTLFTLDYNESSDGVDATATMTCVLGEHIDNKTFTLSEDTYTFYDLLQVECSVNTIVIGQIGDIVVNETSVDKKTTYFQKGVGQVLEYNKDCMNEYEIVHDEMAECVSMTERWDVIQLEGASATVTQTPNVEDDSNANNSVDYEIPEDVIAKISIYKNMDESQAGAVKTASQILGYTVSDSNEQSSCSQYGYSTVIETMPYVVFYTNGVDVAQYCEELDYSALTGMSGSTNFTVTR
jgi:hypothetical protein